MTSPGPLTTALLSRPWQQDTTLVVFLTKPELKAFSKMWWQLMSTGVLVSMPAMQAVRKQAMVPAIRALIAPAVMSRFLEGAMEVSPPITIPREPKLAKPQRA